MTNVEIIMRTQRVCDKCKGDFNPYMLVSEIIGKEKVKMVWLCSKCLSELKAIINKSTARRLNDIARWFEKK